MTHLDSRASISIFQLIFFFPSLLAAGYLLNKHGLGRNSGWFFLLTVSLFRLAGAATQLATYSHPSTGLFTASAILSSFGLSTLLLSSAGFLHRCADSSSLSRNGLLNPLAFRAAQLLVSAGLIVVIVGDSNITFTASPSGDGAGTISVPIEAKVGIIVITAVWLLICAITITVIRGIGAVIGSERPLAWVVVVGLPFILIRLVYAILTIYINDKNFNLLSPSTAVEWTLAVIEECFVVLIYLLVGFKVPKILPAEQAAVSGVGDARPGTDTNASQTPMTGQEQRPAGQKKSGVRWRGTPLLTLVGIFTDMYSRRKQGHEEREMGQVGVKQGGQQSSMA